MIEEVNDPVNGEVGIVMFRKCKIDFRVAYECSLYLFSTRVVFL